MTVIKFRKFHNSSLVNSSRNNYCISKVQLEDVRFLSSVAMPLVLLCMYSWYIRACLSQFIVVRLVHIYSRFLHLRLASQSLLRCSAACSSMYFF